MRFCHADQQGAEGRRWPRWAKCSPAEGTLRCSTTMATGALLRDLPGVIRVNDSGKRAELFLAEDADSQAVLAALVHKVHIRGFALRTASLHEIFIRSIGEADDA